MQFTKNKTRKKYLLFQVMAITFLLLSPSFTNRVSAQESYTNIAEYDLMEGGTQEFIITDKNDDLIYVTIEEVYGISRITNGTYKVTYSKPLSWEAGFNIMISSNKITSVSSPFYTVYTGGILSPSLVKESSTQASYYFIYKLAGIYMDTGVRAVISGTTLKTSAI